jgi:hypothetical protein
VTLQTYHLDYLALRAVHKFVESLPESHLAGLVGLFCHHPTMQFKLIYLDDPSPILEDSTRGSAIALEQLQEEQSLPSDDRLLVGISALDVIRKDLVTKGQNFYPLESLLAEFGQYSVLNTTRYQFARVLANLPKSGDHTYQQRVVIKTLQMALPSWLDRHRPDDLVAATISGDNFTAFVTGEQGPASFTSKNLLDFPTLDDKTWFIALEEVRHFLPGQDLGEHFIDLRNVMRQAGHHQTLKKSCLQLARRCFELSSQPDYPSLQDVAWALAIEARLMDEDTEDLVAILPLSDFTEFIHSGAALRVYRVWDEQSVPDLPGMQWSLSTLTKTKQLPDNYCRYAFSILSLETIAPELVEVPTEVDLCDLLSKAGHSSNLARTMLLLAQMALWSDSDVRCPADMLYDMARRAMLLISLDNPWHCRQGRYQQMIETAYHVLDQAIQQQVDVNQTEDDRLYFEAIQDWYGCAQATTTEAVKQKLHQMGTRLRRFKALTHREEGDLLRENTRQLIEIEETALYPLVSSGTGADFYPSLETRMLPSDLDRIRQLAVRSMAGRPCLSANFESVWEQLRRLRNEIHKTQNEYNLTTQRLSLEKFYHYAQRDRNLIFVPPHEKAVLFTIYDREIEILRGRIEELKTEAMLEILPVNMRVEYLRDINLEFEVRNFGGVDAYDVNLALIRDDKYFRLLDRSAVREYTELPSGVPQRFNYQVRVVSKTDALFQFNYTYQGLEEPRKIQIALPVRSLDEGPFKPKRDPYKFGRAIQTPTDFYGRRDKIREIIASLARGGHTSFLLRGPRRMGKTSLLYILQHILKNPVIHPHFDIPQSWTADLSNCHPIMLDLQAFNFQKDQSHAVRFFFTLLDKVTVAISPVLHNTVLSSFEKRQHEIGPANAVLEQLDRVFSVKPTTRGVILLDEYDEIYHDEGDNLDKMLRHVVQGEIRLTWVIASTQFLYQEGKSHGSPWFNILNIIELESLSDRAAQRLVEEPSRTERVEWQSDAVVKLLHETGRHPAFLQLFSSKVISYLNQEEQNYVLPQTIVMLANALVGEQETIHNHFEFYWTDTPGVGQLILLLVDDSNQAVTIKSLRNTVLARLGQEFGVRPEKTVTKLRNPRSKEEKEEKTPWWQREFEESLDWVSSAVNAISYNRSNRSYTFTVPLFRRWLQQKRQYENLDATALARIANEMERDHV